MMLGEEEMGGGADMGVGSTPCLACIDDLGCWRGEITMGVQRYNPFSTLTGPLGRLVLAITLHRTIDRSEGMSTAGSVMMGSMVPPSC